MKTYLILGFAAAASMLTSSTSHALVSVVQDCTTQNGQYTIQILDNEGIGPRRVGALGASITDDSHNVVGGYAIDQAKVHPFGFGEPYVDTATSGKKFDLTPPDTNVRTFTLHAVLSNGTVLNDDNLKCSSL